MRRLTFNIEKKYYCITKPRVFRFETGQLFGVRHSVRGLSAGGRQALQLLA